MAVHLLSSLTWPQARDLALTRAVAVLPVGAIEAHGPHLPLATDVVIAEAMARAGAGRLSARGHEVLLLPALPFAPAPYAAGFAGTVSVDASAVAALVAGIARSLGHHGVRVLAIANAHFDPAHVTALRELEGAWPHARHCRLVFPDLTRRRWAQRLTDEFRGGACHAGRYESSIVLAERPDWVRAEVMHDLPPNDASLVEAARAGKRTFEEAGGTQAYFGAPAKATAEEGRLIVDVLGEILEEAVMEAI